MMRSKPQPPTGPRTAAWDNPMLLAFCCVALAACIYGGYHNTFHVPFLLDDDDSISRNPTIRSFATAFFPPTQSGITVSGRPLLNFTLAINYHLGGTNVVGYHVGNLLIHCAAALTLFGIVRQTLRLPKLEPRFGAYATPFAWFVAALWALHPLQTESVTYIIQRAESLVGLCYLFTLYAFIRATQSASRTWAVVAGFSCILGMAAKEVMASAPLLIFLYDRTFVSGSFREAWHQHRRLHLAFASGWLLLGALVLASGGRGTTVGFAQVSAWDYLLTQASAIIRYLRLAVLPNDLVFDYGPTVEKTPEVLARSTALLTPLLLATAIALKKLPMIGFLGASFFLILAPTSSVIPVATQTIAEHRMYLPLAGLVAGFTVLLFRVSTRYCWAVLALLAGVCVVSTLKRNITYQSNLSLWEDTVRKMPDNIRALNNLGLNYIEANRVDDAIRCFAEALDLVPEYPVATCNLGRALILKEALAAGVEKLSGDFAHDPRAPNSQNSRVAPKELLSLPTVQSGLALLEKAIRAEPYNARFISTQANAFFSLQEVEKAAQLFEKAVALEPDNWEIHYDLANTLARLDRNEEAAKHFQVALQVKPKHAELLTNYGALLRRMRRLPESIEHLQKAIELQPGVPRIHSNYGVALLESGRTQEGIDQLEKALRLDPNLPQARYNLSNAMAESGRTEEAIEHLEALLKIAPPTAELLSNLGVLYARANRFDDAIQQMRLALDLDPRYEPAKENLAKISAYLRATRR